MSAAPNTRLYLDCEFNGFGGQLISMALVAEDGREWYEVLPLPITATHDFVDPWVRLNVVPILGKPPISHASFRQSLFAFLANFDNPIIVADWYTDLVHFFSCFAGRDHSESRSYPCRAQLVASVPGYAPKQPHNALSDARAIKDALA